MNSNDLNVGTGDPLVASAATIVTEPAAMEVRAADPALDGAKKEVAIVDTSLADYKTLEAGIRAGVGIVEFDGTKDGLAQIAQWAGTQSGLDAVHVLSHGSAGMIQLGTTQLTVSSLADGMVQSGLAQLGQALAPQGDLLFYGCDVADGTNGAALLDGIAKATGADVAASTDLTGPAALGGNWTLEQSTGTIETTSLAPAGYNHLLAAQNLTYDFEFGVTGDLSGGTSTVIQTKNGVSLTVTAATDPIFDDNAAGLPDIDGSESLLAGAISGETQLTFTIANGYAFNLSSITLRNEGGDNTFRISAGGTDQDIFVAGTGLATANGFSSAFNGITSFTITTTGGPFSLSVDDIVLMNVAPPAPTVSDSHIAITSTGHGTGGAYLIGDTLTARWDNSAAGDNQSNITNVTMDFSAFGGGTAVVATLDGSGHWTAQYTINSGTIDATNRNISVTATSGTGYTTTTADTTNLTVDNQPPTLTDANISISGASGAGGAFKTGDTVTATWNNTAGGDNNSDSISSVKVDFSQFGASSPVTATNSGGTWTATYQIVAGAGNGTANHNVIVTATDNAGNASTVADSTNATLDNVAPTVTFSNLAFSDDTGAPDFITSNASQTVSATLSAAPAGSDIVYGSLDNGSTWTDVTSKVSGTTLTWNGVTLSGSNTLKLKVTDAAGNDGAATSQAYTLDNTAPAAPDTLDMTSGTDSGVSHTDHITSNTTPTFTGHAEAGSKVTLYDTDGTTVLGTTTAVGGSWTIASSTLLPGDHNITAKATDAAGNVSAAANPLTVTIDTTAPTVTSVDTPADGVYKQGDALTFTVHTSEAVTIVSGSPTLPIFLSDGGGLRAAQYVSGSGTAALTFSYTVQAGDLDGNGIDLGNVDVSGANITDAAGNTFDGMIGYAVPTGNIHVDAVAPSVNSVSVPAAGTYYAGQDLDLSVDFSEAVTVDTSGGTPRIALTLDTGGTVYADYVSGSGTGTLVFRHTVSAGEADATGITVGSLSLHGGTIRDGAANDADTTLNSVGSTSMVNVDGSLPKVTSVGASVADGAYKAGATITIDVNLDHTVTVDTSNGVPTLALSSGGTATYSGGSGSSTLSFTYMIGAGENAADLDANSTAALALNGASIKDAGGAHVDADTTLPVPGAAGSLGAARDIVVDTTAPANEATAVAFSSDTGTSSTDMVTMAAAQTITGTLSAPLAAGEAVKVSLDNGATWLAATASAGSATFTLAGQTLTGSDTLMVKVSDLAGNDGSVYAHAYVLDTVAPAITAGAIAISADTGSSTGDFLTKAGSQTITASLSAAPGVTDVVYGSVDGGATWTDITAKVSGTTITWDGAQLASGAHSIEFKVTDAAGNDGATANQAYTLATTAPATTVSAAAFSNDTGLSASDFITSSAAQTISGTLSANINAGETVYVSLDGGASWSAASASGNTWTLAGQTLAGSGTLEVKVSDAAGNDGATYSQAYVLDTGPAATFSSVALSSDTGSSSTDFVTNTAAQTISATLSAALSAGDTVYGSLDGGATWTDITAKVAGTTLAWDGVILSGTSSIELKVSDAAGNAGVAAIHAYSVDTTPPAAPGTPALTAASDTDARGDGVTHAAPVVEGAAAANAKVELYDGATKIGTTTADAGGNWVIAPAGLQLGAHTLTARQYDVAGNQSDASAAFTLHLEQAPAAPTNLIDGVAVGFSPVTLPDGQIGTVVDIPVVTAGRADTTGSHDVADIPLASTSSGDSILTAQVAPGFGLTATGASMPAASANQALIAAIQAATPGHAADDLGHLTGNGQGFLDTLPSTQSLLVQTVVPVTAGPAAPAGMLTLSGQAGAAQDVALVIDSTHLPQGSTIALENVDFAAVIGNANVVADNTTQVLSGDAGSQHFMIAAGGSGAIVAGGGDDVLTLGAPPAQQAPAQGVTLLHGGTGADTATFDGARDSFTVELHNGYEVVSSKADPAVKALVVNVEQLSFADGTVAVPGSEGLDKIAGLYQSIFGRQADLYGFEFWADASQKLGLSLGAVALDMVSASEWTRTHDGINGDAGHDVALLYNALFGRAADAAGLEFWTDAMQHGLTLEQVATDMLLSAEITGHSRAPTGWDFTV